MIAMSAVVHGAWLAVVAILFRRLGPARATLIAVFAAFLVLPRTVPCEPLFGVLAINKRTVSGLALILGVLLADPRALIRVRPRIVDLPMAAFVLMPLVAAAGNRFAEFSVTGGQLWSNVLEWGMPYLLGRLYFGDVDAPRRLSIAVAVAGLCYVPVCVYEISAGPDHYLLGLFYGERPHSHMVERLGGYRPEGFLTNGIELATWMAMASTVAFWLWLRRAWSPSKVPSWAPALTLTLATIACRGAYGYMTLALGLGTAAISHALRTRFLMLALTLVPPAYVIARMSSFWDGKPLVELAAKAGSGGSIAYRLRAEEMYLAKVFEHNPALGYGGKVGESAIFDWWAKNHLWPDGWWIHQVRASGVIGLAVFALAFFLVPAWLALALPSGRTWRASPGSLAWGLALFLILHFFDSLHNMAFLPQSTLIGGSLTGVFLRRRSNRLDVPPTPRQLESRGQDDRIALLVTIVLLAGLEIFGRSTKTFPPPSAGPPAESAPPKGQP